MLLGWSYLGPPQHVTGHDTAGLLVSHDKGDRAGWAWRGVRDETPGACRSHALSGPITREVRTVR